MKVFTKPVGITLSDIETVQAGRQAATRGRSEDVISAYQALRPEAQAAFRSGYVDPLIAQTEGATFGVNKARPFTNDAFGAEASAMAGNDLMQRRLRREMTIRDTQRCIGAARAESGHTAAAPPSRVMNCAVDRMASNPERNQSSNRT